MGRTRGLSEEMSAEGEVRLFAPDAEPDCQLNEWRYKGFVILERIWTLAQWERIPPAERPRALDNGDAGWSLITVRRV